MFDPKLSGRAPETVASREELDPRVVMAGDGMRWPDSPPAPQAKRSQPSDCVTGGAAPRRRPQPRHACHRLRIVPLHGATNLILLAIIRIALVLLIWLPLLAWLDKHGLLAPGPLRLRLFSPPSSPSRRRYLRLAKRWPWTDVVTKILNWFIPSRDQAGQHHFISVSSISSPKAWSPAYTRHNSWAVKLPRLRKTHQTTKGPSAG